MLKDEQERVPSQLLLLGNEPWMGVQTLQAPLAAPGGAEPTQGPTGDPAAPGEERIIQERSQTIPHLLSKCQ